MLNMPGGGLHLGIASRLTAVLAGLITFRSAGVLLVGLLALVAVGLFAIVIFPAVWSRKDARQKAALEVIKSIFGRR